MGMSVGGGSGVKAEPNVVPMIDIMLVLLIIFMIIVPALVSGFNAVPPQGVNLKTHPPDDEEIMLGIDAKGQYYLQKKPIRNETLYDQLKAIYDVRTIDKILYLKADRNLQYDRVIEVLDVAARAGARMTGMIADQEPGTKSSVAGDEPAPEGKAGGSQ